MMVPSNNHTTVERKKKPLKDQFRKYQVYKVGVYLNSTVELF